MKKKKYQRVMGIAALVCILSGCIPANYPFLSPEDRALAEEVRAVVALHSDVINVSVVQGRVYLTGNCVDIYGLVETLVEEIRYMDGVKAVFEDVKICGDNDDWNSLQGRSQTVDKVLAIQPGLLFKILFIGYLFGIRSERQLVREVEVNAVYRWFLDLTLTGKVPLFSTFSQNRHRRFNESGIYQEVFDEIVLQAVKRKMVDGKVLYTNFTHMKASASKGKYQKPVVLRSVRNYLEELDKDIAEDREQHGKKPLKTKDAEPATKEIKISTTDPDSGYMVRSGRIVFSRSLKSIQQHEIYG